MPNRGTDPLGRPRGLTLLLLLSWLLLAVGVWGPWIWAPPAGLRVLGLDLPEYVKFIAEVRSGAVALTREVFYLPLATLSLSLSLLVHRRELALPAWARWVLNAFAVPSALAMLPPAWTPPLLTTPEFVKQTVAIGICLAAAVAAFPLLRFLPRLLAGALVAGLALLAAIPPLVAFTRLRSAFDAIYGQPIAVGIGIWSAAAGALLLALAAALLLIRTVPRGSSSS